MAAGVNVEGLAEKIRDLEATAREVQDMRAVFTDLSRRAATLAASFAPRRSGRLQASISPGTGENRATVVATAPYARTINYGPGAYKPSGFMQKASDRIEPAAMSEIEGAIVELIKEKNL